MKPRTSITQSSLVAVFASEVGARVKRCVMNELKPCPFCGSTDLFVEDGIDHYRIECRSCLASGPAVRMPDEAAKPWNLRKSHWISVEESLPEEGLNVLIVHNGIVDIGYHQNGEWYSNTPYHRFLDVEYWCYLPQLPEASNDRPKS